MISRFFDQQDPSNPHNGSIVQNRDKLERITEEASQRKPFIANLIADNGFMLTFGLGPDVGFVQFCSNERIPPYLVALRYPEASKDEYVEFLATNTPTPIAKRYCFPIAEIVEILWYFVETGEQSQEVEWEEI